jgi:hypothetical protein
MSFRSSATAAMPDIRQGLGQMRERIPSFHSLTEAVVAGYTGEPVWVWALWRPCLVAVVFVAILFRFLERFSTGPPAPWLASPLLFTLVYCLMLARAVPPNERAEPGSNIARSARHYGGVLDLAAVERWQYALNLHQLLISSWVCVALVVEVRALGMHVWGNRYDPSPRGYRLGWLVWVVYSNRYLQGLDTLFLLLRDKVGCCCGCGCCWLPACCYLLLPLCCPAAAPAPAAAHACCCPACPACPWQRLEGQGGAAGAAPDAVCARVHVCRLC